MAGSKVVSAVVGTGRNRPGGGKETGGRDNDEIGDGFGGGVGRVIEWGLWRRRRVSGSKRVDWSGRDLGGGQISDQPRQTTGRKHGR